jgi:hypothetical protein
MVRLLLVILSWTAGIAAYAAALGGFYGEDLSGGDLYAVLFWSLLAWCAVSLGVLLPSFRWLSCVAVGTGIPQLWE